MIRRLAALLSFSLLLPGQEIVAFPSGNLTLRGVVYKPPGPGPFPAVLYNHGSAKETSAVSDALGPLFAARGWVFFMPSRRGQGLSATVGPFIGDVIDAAIKQKGLPAAAEIMVHLLETDHLDDQLAALAWLQKNGFVAPNRIAVAGNSFGGVEPSSVRKKNGIAPPSSRPGAPKAGSRRRYSGRS